MGKRLGRKFFTQNTLLVSRKLLGKYIIRRFKKGKIVGKIVETEAYLGPKDKASHAYGGKITFRNIAEYLIGGHIYIYLIYGLYWQLNITTDFERPECVLIRALEPIRPNNDLKIASGPGKVCQFLKLDQSFYGEDLVNSKRIWLERGKEKTSFKIVKAKRIGIDYAGIWKEKLWRFYIKNHPSVSRK